MNQATENALESVPVPASEESRVWPHLIILTFGLILGAVMVWQLRQDWAKQHFWPWFILLFAMFIAASALHQLDLWIPGEAILPKLEKVSTQMLTIAGALCVAAALAITWFIVQKLLPDYRQLWHGLPRPWLAAMIFMLVGAGMLGAVGRGSPRAATASAVWSDSPRSRWLEAAAFLLILALAIFLRTYHFNTIPPGIYVDETNGSLDALYILEGRDVSPFGTGWYGTPNGYIYYMAGMFKLLGANWLSLKLISLIPAILTVAAIYFLGRLVFGPTAGLFAMLFLAVSRWHLSMSRWGWNETAPPLFQILATFFLIRGLRDRRASDYALSGLIMGLSIYTYLSARLAAATVLLYILYWIFTEPSGVQASLRRSWLGFVLFGLAAFVAVAPLAVTYFKDPFTMNNRVSEISVMRQIRDQNSLKPLVQNIGDVLKFFHQTGDHQGKHNLPDEPMTDPITGLLFAIGLAYAVLRWRDQRYFLLIIWLVIGMAGSFLSSHSESPQSYRSLTALPAVVLMAADTLDRIVRLVYRALREQTGKQVQSQMPVYIAGAIAVLALLGATAWESNVYFNKQEISPAVIGGFNPVENQVAHAVIKALQTNQEVYLSPRFSEYSQLRFLVYGIVKSRTGENTLDNRPYHTILPEEDFPVPDTGKDVLILLDNTYWPLRDYVASIYPKAALKLTSLADGSPVYFQIQIPHDQILALQGLLETVSYPSGQSVQHSVPTVHVEAQNQNAAKIEWAGSIHVEHGGQYEFNGEGGLEVFIDQLPVHGAQYLGRGSYRLNVLWNAGDSNDARLLWKTPDQDWTPVPTNVLFNIPDRDQGLLGIYWNNINWENTPVFHQLTPFLMLAWNTEQPIVPNGPFSARYRGTINILEAGTYTFRVEADDGARLRIDGSVIGEGVAPGQPNSFEATIDLSAGEHPIEVEYFQQGGGTALRFLWRHGDEPFTPVPPSVLTPAHP